MLVCTYSDLREHLRERLDQVHESRTPLLVTRQNGPSAVLIDKEEFDGIMATLHLLGSPTNAERLQQSIADAEAGKTVERTLVEE
jgi:antitoxin YefM